MLLWFWDYYDTTWLTNKKNLCQIFFPLFPNSKPYWPLCNVRLQSPHHPLDPSPPSPLCSLQGLAEGPRSPRRPVALGPGSQGDQTALSLRVKPHICWKGCYGGSQGSLISPWPAGTCHVTAASIKTTCLHNVLSVQFMAWLLPTVHLLPTVLE